MRLGIVLKKWRLINEINTKTLAAEIGISAATLWRMEEGRAIDAVTLMKIFIWLCATKEGEK